MEETVSSIMFTHSHINETVPKLSSGKHGDTLINKEYSFENVDRSVSESFKCYTCTRVLHHHHQILPILKTIDEFPCTTTTTTNKSSPTSSSPTFSCQHSDPRYEIREHQSTSPLERFLLEGHDEQSSALALGVEVGALSISPGI